METGEALLSNKDLNWFAKFTCSSVPWPQLGMRTIDEAMALPNFSQYIGITKQNPLSLEALHFLVSGVGRCKDAKDRVPPITCPDGSYINCPEGLAIGFVFFFHFQKQFLV